MTGRARNSTLDHEARWEEAQSILDEAPTESAAERLRRSRRNRWLLIVAFVLLGLALAVLLALFVFDPLIDNERSEEDAPTWRAVTGFSLSGLGLLLMVVALVIQFRGLRRVRAWGSPLHVLTFRQRRELLGQVRGRGPDVHERIPLARHLAEVLLTQRLGLPVMAGLVVNFVGLWIVDQETYRLVFIAVLVAVLIGSSSAFRRESRRARRYLDAHPAPPSESLT